MINLQSCLVAGYLLGAWAHAIPNAIIGNVNQVNAPLNGQEVAPALLAEGLWKGEAKLPGEWRDESLVAGLQTSHLLARPKFLGQEVVLIRAAHRGERLESIQLTFADAGSYFQYQTRVPKADLAARRKELLDKQQNFQKEYDERLGALEGALKKMATGRVKEVRQGSARLLRAESEVYPYEDLKIALLADGRRLIRVVISREVMHRKSWLDQGLLEMGDRARAQRYRKSVEERERGDVIIRGVRAVPQGYKPYCGVNTLVMAAHHFGLHVDEDWLAVGGKFQNTGSAGNSNMFGLYNAVAKEARLQIERERDFDFRKARSLLRDGLPVIVWRRYDHRRNMLHTRVANQFSKGKEDVFPEPDANERKSWPGKNHPVHASVIVGFNDQRKEVLFLESWAGLGVPKRMRYEELEATATWAFYFKTRG